MPKECCNLDSFGKICDNCPNVIASKMNEVEKKQTEEIKENFNQEPQGDNQPRGRRTRDNGDDL